MHVSADDVVFVCDEFEFYHNFFFLSPWDLLIDLVCVC